MGWGISMKILKEYVDYKTITMVSFRNIPLSTNLMKKVFGGKRISTFHLTDIRQISKIKKLEGRKSSIATFNKLNSSIKQLKKGPLTEGGVMVWLEGDLITRFGKDSYTQIDKQGRRWVKWSDLISGVPEAHPYLPTKMLDLSLKATELKNEFDNSADIKKEKAEVIKQYIDVAYKHILKNKDYIVKSSVLNSASGGISEHSNWNELIVNNIKVRGIVILDTWQFRGLWGSDSTGLENEVKKMKTMFPSAEVIVDKSDDDFMKYYKKWGGELVMEGVIDAGEPETGYLPDGETRYLGQSKGRPEYWFDQLGYTQLHFPKADRMRGRGKGRDTDSTFRKVKYKTKNVKVSKLRKALKPFGSNEWPEVVKENIIQEGGAYGHMAHPFDTDINLTFGQLKDIVNRALEGNLEMVTEKLDGQALAISWKNGRLIAARNKGHLKNKGEAALDINGVSTKFQGRGDIEKAYNYAMKDLSNAISSLSEKQREKIFKNGACFMNLEVIYPPSANVIPYGAPFLVFHGTMEYDDDGNPIGENKEAARILAGMIRQVEKDVQDVYTIQGPPVVELPKVQSLASKKPKYLAQITKLQKEFGLSDNDGVAEYHQAWWERWVDKNSPTLLDNTIKMGLVKRWAFGDKGFRLNSKNIEDSKVLDWATKTDKSKEVQTQQKENLMKFEDIFLGVGAEVLKFTDSALVASPDSATQKIRKDIKATIKDVQKRGNPKQIEKLKLELRRLNSIGGLENIVPIEGIVFRYKTTDNIYTLKLTGAFASSNQLLGIFFGG